MIRGLIIAVSLMVLSGCISAPPEIATTPTETPLASTIEPAIRMISYPANVTGEENFTVVWEVSGGVLGEISHSAIHWGFKAGRADVTDYGRFSKVQKGKTPKEFIVEIKAPDSGTIYFRAHAIVDGIDLYSAEYRIAVNPR